MPKITVYTSNGCGYCAQLKRWLTDQNLPFEERNVQENQAYFDDLNNKGIFTTPVAMIDETPVVGFRPNKMKELLGLK